MASAPPKLIYVDDDLPGITRKGAGKGWAYYDPKGALIKDRVEKQRLNAIAFPPAYGDAWFCPAPNGHILATGYDAKGRKQYRYHPDFRAMKESEKFDGCITFGKLLPLVRKRVTEDLQTGDLGKYRVVASVVRLLDLGAIRIGNARYTKANESFGATTLRKKHVDISGNRLDLNFTGKGGKQREVSLSDADLAECVRDLEDLPGQHLFRWEDNHGEVRDVGSADVNAYLSDAMGEPFTAKHFRTWHASVMAFRLLAESGNRLTISAMLEDVAQHLGNTAAVTRKSYVHPAVIELIARQEEWRAGLALPRRTKYLRRWERGLLDLLDESPAAMELLNAAA